jgi:D-alanyl-D-alanine carboxypeptidase
MKTGFICASGFNQVSSATRNGRSVVSVVLGSESLGARADISAGMLEKGLTMRAGKVPTLGQLRPYGETRNEVADLSQEICSKHAAKVRSEGRDEAGRQKLASPYIHELNRPLKLVFAGLMGGDTATPAGDDEVASRDMGDAVNIPIPIPRPAF